MLLQVGPEKLRQRVKIAHSFFQSVPDQFNVIIFSLPMYSFTNSCQRIFRNPLFLFDIDYKSE